MIHAKYFIFQGQQEFYAVSSSTKAHLQPFKSYNSNNNNDTLQTDKHYYVPLSAGKMYEVIVHCTQSVANELFKLKEDEAFQNKTCIFFSFFLIWLYNDSGGQSSDQIEIGREKKYININK